jgi:hypothetical protein
MANPVACGCLVKNNQFAAIMPRFPVFSFVSLGMFQFVICHGRYLRDRLCGSRILEVF